MITSCKLSARQLAGALYEYDVRDVVVSPGSRNTPLILAFDADERISKHVIIDERSAAFAAMGMALQSGRPAACVCTSGSAVLNYAPAVAEAYYRGVPLIVVSADRPSEWIDHDDSQTIRQPGALSNIVKGSFDIDETFSADRVCRMLNDALSLAMHGRRGPVHINMQFAEPLGDTLRSDESGFHYISREYPTHPMLSLPGMDYNRIMIVAGFHSPDCQYADILMKLWTECGIPVLCEAQSNIAAISASMAMKVMSGRHYGCCNPADFRPELVISVGGSIVSKELKNFLRHADVKEHWYVGYGDRAVDCYRHLTRRFDMDEMVFLRALYRHFARRPAQAYGSLWTGLFLRAADIAEEYIDNAPWCDMKAVKMVLDYGNSPETGGMSLHLGNGTVVRYAQMANFYTWHDVECNRGVSGIDGSTSTAVGASLAGGRVMLVCGDMSAQYDMGALAINDIPDDFRMVVVDNHGGGIFRVIGSTQNMDAEMLQRYYSGNINLPLGQLAAAFGFEYFEAGSTEEFQREFPLFMASGRKAIMRLVTDPRVNVQVFNGF